MRDHADPHDAFKDPAGPTTDPENGVATSPCFSWPKLLTQESQVRFRGVWGLEVTQVLISLGSERTGRNIGNHVVKTQNFDKNVSVQLFNAQQPPQNPPKPSKA